jgi:hypothetical protein
MTAEGGGRGGEVGMGSVLDAIVSIWICRI